MACGSGCRRTCPCRRHHGMRNAPAPHSTPRSPTWAFPRASPDSAAEGNVTYIEHHRGLPDREFLVNRVTVDGEALSVGGSLDTGPGVAREKRVPLLAQRLKLVLTDVNRHWGKVRSLAVGRVVANFGDSTLTVDSIRIAPHYSPTPRRTGVQRRARQHALCRAGLRALRRRPRRQHSPGHRGECVVRREGGRRRS